MKTIDGIMALADAYAKAYADCTYTEREDLVAALEAALKPGEPVALLAPNVSYGEVGEQEFHVIAKDTHSAVCDLLGAFPVYRAAPPAQTPPDVESLHGSIMGAVYDFRDAHLTGGTNLKRTAHEALDAAVRQALTRQ